MIDPIKPLIDRMIADGRGRTESERKRNGGAADSVQEDALVKNVVVLTAAHIKATPTSPRSKGCFPVDGAIDITITERMTQYIFFNFVFLKGPCDCCYMLKR